MRDMREFIKVSMHTDLLGHPSFQNSSSAIDKDIASGVGDCDPVTVRVCHTTGRIACLHPKMPRWKSRSQNGTLGSQHFLGQEGNLSSVLHVWLMQSTGRPPGRSQCDYLWVGMDCGREGESGTEGFFVCVCSLTRQSLWAHTTLSVL